MECLDGNASPHAERLCDFPVSQLAAFGVCSKLALLRKASLSTSSDGIYVAAISSYGCSSKYTDGIVS